MGLRKVDTAASHRADFDAVAVERVAMSDAKDGCENVESAAVAAEAPLAVLRIQDRRDNSCSSSVMWLLEEEAPRDGRNQKDKARPAEPSPDQLSPYGVRSTSASCLPLPTARDRGVVEDRESPTICNRGT